MLLLHCPQNPIVKQNNVLAHIIVRNIRGRYSLTMLLTEMSLGCSKKDPHPFPKGVREIQGP